MKKLAVLGSEGTFSEKASHVITNCERVYYPTIDQVFHAVESEVDLAIIPIENSLDGFVQRTLDLLIETNTHIIGEVVFPIRFNFLSNVKDPAACEEIYVQFKSNGQCRHFLESLPGKIITTESNTESYERLKKANISAGAVVPAHIKDTTYHEKENIADQDDNFTRFIIVDKKSEPNLTDQLKATLCIIPQNDKPGLLFRILEEFYQYHLNLVSIMSRPTKKKMGTYNFFIEIHLQKAELDALNKALNKLKERYEIKILGIYSTWKE